MHVIPVDFGMVKAYIVKDLGAILVDTGCFCGEEELWSKLNDLRIREREIGLIVITHAHFDHCQLAAAWKKLTGAKVLCHKNAVEYLTTGKRRPYNYSIAKEEHPDYIAHMEDPEQEKHFIRTEPDIVIGDEDFDLHPFGIQGKIIYTPGHADSEVAVVLENREAIIGDTLMLNYSEKGEPIPGVSWICDDPAVMKASMEKLLKEADLYYAGHGGPYSREFLKKQLSEG